MNERAQWLRTAGEIATEAGAILMQGWRKAPTVRKKSAIDLVTDYDLRSEALLRRRMAAAFPGHSVVAEEGHDRAHGDWVWYVDPLDGTTNFAHGHFFFAVSIGLAYRGKPSLGVVHAPALATTWSGGLELGATRNGEACRISRNGNLGDALVATGFPYDRAESDENNLREASYIIPRVRGMRRCGAAAIDLVLVADGTYDGYWEQKLAPWDACAGVAIVQGAGGKVTDYDGHEVRAVTHRFVATNGALHEPLLQAVRTARGSG